MGATVGESDSRSDEKVLDGTGHEDFVVLGMAAHSLGDGERGSADPVADEVDFPGVDASTQPHASGWGWVPERQGAADGPARRVESGQDPLGGVSSQDPAVGLDGRQACRSAYSLGEQDGREDPGRFGRARAAARKFWIRANIESSSSLSANRRTWSPGCSK